jgi:uncharacterized oxidoreductase
MKLAGNSVLITGGASGIGFALAERFLAAGSQVLICGRREERLRSVKDKHPEIKTRICDIARESDRIALRDWAVRESPGLSVVVNNAGIQRRFLLLEDSDWDAVREEIVINFEAQVHLSLLLIPLFRKLPHAAIVNVTSGLGFVPMASAPVYSATKAALRSFTLSLRHQLRDTPIEVVELIPPAVDTDLGGVGLHTFGVPLGEFADHAAARLDAGDLEITYGFSQQGSRASRDQLDEMFRRLNSER